MDTGELRLKQGEEIVRTAKISKAAIIMIWAVIPFFLLIIFLTVYLPPLITYTVNTALRDALLEELGLTELNISDIMNKAYLEALSFLPKGLVSFIRGFVIFLVVLAVACWFGWACVYTFMNIRYSLVITNMRVFARAKDKVFEAELSGILNVDVAVSLWGKLFKYGEIHIQAEKDAVTIRNIAGAQEYKSLLLTEKN